jgi:hypothetical protein
VSRGRHPALHSLRKTLPPPPNTNELFFKKAFYFLPGIPYIYNAIIFFHKNNAPMDITPTPEQPFAPPVLTIGPEAQAILNPPANGLPSSAYWDSSFVASSSF